MRKNNKLFLLVILLVIVLLFCLYYLKLSSKNIIDQYTLYEVASVLDGDTFRVKIKGDIVTVRMLGINTPETVDPRKGVECFGLESSKKTKKLLVGRRVYLKLNPKREVTDKYGRYLAYVYRDDGLFVNQDLITYGYAREYTYGSSYLFQKEFKSLEKQAQESNTGLWGACD